jgi:hypothetical protein
MNEPRNFKWMIPGMFVPIWIIVLVWMVSNSNWWIQLAGLIPAFGVLVFGLAAIKNFKAYFSTLDTDNFVARQRASIQTPETLIFEAARGMHPETARLALEHRKTTLTIKAKDYEPDDYLDMVLEEAPKVHLGFMLFFLHNSTASQCMSKRLLSEGSRKMDPTGVILDREQYDAFAEVLQKKMMVTKPYGESMPPLWIANYDPETAAKKLGIWPWYREEEEETESMVK